MGFLTGGVVAGPVHVPAGVAIWRNLDVLTEEVMGYFLPPGGERRKTLPGQNLKKVVRNSLLIVVLLLTRNLEHTLHHPSVPPGKRLRALDCGGRWLVITAAAVAVAAFQIHGSLEDVPSGALSWEVRTITGMTSTSWITSWGRLPPL